MRRLTPKGPSRADRTHCTQPGGSGRRLAQLVHAHPQTLAAILHAYRNDTAPILIEATCNQVNQSGGYTGMTPADFVGFVHGIARSGGVDFARVILGGDHLGPNPWKAEPAARAMANARDMVAAYVAAGFTKIHLDASMACRGEVLAEAEMAARAADLCAVAESVAPGRLVYVIGTEVPVPGGETEHQAQLEGTSAESARQTLALHRAAFAARGLDAAFARVVGVVVQPGVDFGNDQIMVYDRPRAASLAAVAPALDGPLYEAHSTDYQTPAALAALVQDHFAILKVGPELTFAFRQAVMALERVEGLVGLPLSGVTAALLAAARSPRRLARLCAAGAGRRADDALRPVGPAALLLARARGSGCVGRADDRPCGGQTAARLGRAGDRRAGLCRHFARHRDPPHGWRGHPEIPHRNRSLRCP